MPTNAITTIPNLARGPLAPNLSGDKPNAVPNAPEFDEWLQSTAQPSTTTSADSSGQMRFDYLNLLVTQLRNQNPLEPLDNNEMASQLSQFAQLEQLENLNGAFQSLLAATQVSQAATLVGKRISYYLDDSSAPLTGRVDRVEFDDGEVWLMVGKHAIGFGNILSVEN